MRYLLELYKSNFPLSKAEAITLSNAKKHRVLSNLILVDSNHVDFSRLAYTKKAFRLLFQVSLKDFEKKMKGYEWNKAYRHNFSIQVDGDKKYTEQQLAKYVWYAVKKPKVQLKGSKTPLVFFFIERKAFCCLKIWETDEKYEERRSHLRPRPSPISLHPRLARAMVNLSGARKGDLVLDPFCGSGGILIEAGLIGMKIEGSDLSRKMIWKSMVNLKHYGLKAELEVRDFFEISKRYDYIVCDPPYGLNASIMETFRVTKKNRDHITKALETFYEKILLQLDCIVKKKAVIIFPHYIDYKKPLKKTKLKLTNEFEQYIHSNLTRKILVLERRSA